MLSTVTHFKHHRQNSSNKNLLSTEQAKEFFLKELATVTTVGIDGTFKTVSAAPADLKSFLTFQVVFKSMSFPMAYVLLRRWTEETYITLFNIFNKRFQKADGDIAGSITPNQLYGIVISKEVLKQLVFSEWFFHCLICLLFGVIFYILDFYLYYDMYTGVRDYGAGRSTRNLLIQQFPPWPLY
ncbi:hypothetical protein QTP88_013006 [Uroleucon formosanum]